MSLEWAIIGALRDCLFVWACDTRLASSSGLISRLFVGRNDSLTLNLSYKEPDLLGYLT